MRIPSVVSLLIRSGPTAVVLGVWAVIVNAIERMATARTSPHVAKEGLETVAPIVAHGDTASTPSGVSLIRCVVAATLGGAPCSVFLRDLSSWRISVGSYSLPNTIVSETAATRSFPMSQIAAVDVLYLSAFASTDPLEAVAGLLIRPSDNSEASEDSADEWYEPCLPMSLSHFHRLYQ